MERVRLPSHAGLRRIRAGTGAWAMALKPAPRPRAQHRDSKEAAIDSESDIPGASGIAGRRPARRRTAPPCAASAAPLGARDNGTSRQGSAPRRASLRRARLWTTTPSGTYCAWGGSSVWSGTPLRRERGPPGRAKPRLLQEKSRGESQRQDWIEYLTLGGSPASPLSASKVMVPFCPNPNDRLLVIEILSLSPGSRLPSLGLTET